jgi:hypothetical protein
MNISTVFKHYQYYKNIVSVGDLSLRYVYNFYYKSTKLAQIY